MFFFFHDVDQDLFDHDYVNHVHHHSDAPLDDCDDHDNNHDGEDEEGCEGSGQVHYDHGDVRDRDHEDDHGYADHVDHHGQIGV